VNPATTRKVVGKSTGDGFDGGGSGSVGGSFDAKVKLAGAGVLAAGGTVNRGLLCSSVYSD